MKLNEYCNLSAGAGGWRFHSRNQAAGLKLDMRMRIVGTESKSRDKVERLSFLKLPILLHAVA